MYSPQSAAALIADAHGQALRLLTAHAGGKSFEGLAAAAHHLRRQGRIPNALSKKCDRLDAAFHVCTHITEVKSRAFVQELAEALNRPPVKNTFIHFAQPHGDMGMGSSSAPETCADGGSEGEISSIAEDSTGLCHAATSDDDTSTTTVSLDAKPRAQQIPISELGAVTYDISTPRPGCVRALTQMFETSCGKPFHSLGQFAAKYSYVLKPATPLPLGPSHYSCPHNDDILWMTVLAHTTDLPGDDFATLPAVDFEDALHTHRLRIGGLRLDIENAQYLLSTWLLDVHGIPSMPERFWARYTSLDSPYPTLAEDFISEYLHVPGALWPRGNPQLREVWDDMEAADMI